MCCVYDGLEPYNHYEPQQDTNNPNPGNKYPSVPLAHAVNMKESYENMKLLLEKDSLWKI
jgi:hypothetical protein